MAKGVAITVRGLDEIRKKFGALPERLSVQVDAEMGTVANDFATAAAEAAPLDQGAIKRDISAPHIGLMDWRVVSPQAHSAFVEFGTRGRTRVPSGLSAFAAQFKGGGNKGDAKKAIFAWCKRKGIEPKAWWHIYISVMTKGIHPHPFFFPQLPIAQAKLINQLKEAIAKALK